MNPEAKIRRIERALEALEPQEADCALCPRECRVDRRTARAGVCRSGRRAIVSHALLHYGEEPVISGASVPADSAGRGSRRRSGSGTVFFAGCNLKCLFCQNYQLSWKLQGSETGDEELAAAMLGLQARGAGNINLVSPTHLILPVLRALRLAISRGLGIPLVWNSNGYEKAEVIERLAGIVDVWLPDLKYVSPVPAREYSGAADYFDQAGPAIREMYVQQPDLVLDGNEMAARGLIIRHLVLPGNAEDSRAVLEWIAGTLTPHVPVSLMSQYRPCFCAPEPIRRPLSAREYQSVLERARELGFDHLFLQPEVFGPEDHLVPDFDLEAPFRWK
jgi:putative pyruvate formate lyase activating enzyme